MKKTPLFRGLRVKVESISLFLKLLFGAVLLILSTSVTYAQDNLVEGRWKTTWGDMTLQQQGMRIQGNYAEDNGEVYGELSGNVFSGIWIEDSSSKRCSTPRNGRYYWAKSVWILV